jgi:CheY-like chemotaxis protein
MNQPLNILIVEDEPDLREVFSEMLRMLGCEVSEAGNGKQALTQLQGQTFDALFTDLQMPEMDGRALIQAIHDLKMKVNPPIYIMTGRIDKDPRTDMDPSVSSLVKNILPKPFSYGQISELLNTIPHH